MTSISKLLGAGAAVAAIGILGTYAFAQQGPGFGPGRMGPGMMKGMGPSMMGKGHGPMGAMTDPAAHLATLKTDLGIKPDQQAAWDVYAKVVTETAAAMRGHRDHISPGEIGKMEPKDRDAFAATMQKQVTESQAKVKAAAEALLANLDDTQKAKARETLPGLVAAGPAAGMRHGMMGPGKGMGPPWMR